MAERNDIVITWPLSPRIITVLAGGLQDKEITQQDLLDTLRKKESELSALDDDPIVDAAGKEDLGGGVTVGISTTLKNAQLSFEARITPTETGTSTLAGTTTLEDSAAHFITKGIQRGALIINFTDFSVAEVLSVESQTQLTHRSLKGGINNDWTIGDTYRIFNIVQCSASGGNLVAVDEAGNPISPIFPSAFTQVVKTASSSATLQELSAIQYSSFNGGVTIDVINGVPGTAFPIGTPETPVNNVNDAMEIATARGFKNLFILGNLDLIAGNNVSDMIISGRSSIHTLLNIDGDASVTNTIFKDLTITGTLDGGNIIDTCTVLDLYYVNGQIVNSLIEPITIELGGTASAKFINCFGGANGSETFVVDMGGSGQALALYNFSGEVKIINKTGTDTVTIGVTGAKVELDSTIANGSIEIRGTGNLINNVTGSASVDVTGFSEGVQVLYAKTVYVDIAGEAGITFPIGTFTRPVNNIPDALKILGNVYGSMLVFLSNFDIPNSTNFDGLFVESRGNFSAGLTFGTGCSINLTTFKDIVLTGELNGDAAFNHCFLENCTKVEGSFKDCMFNGTIAFLDLVGDSANIIINGGRSQSRDPTHFVVGSANLNATDMFGFFRLIGKDTDAECQLHFAFGVLTIENTCTAGTIYAAGIGRVINQTGGSAIISQMSGPITDTVYVDSDGTAGTDFPIGSAKMPVSNLTDALAIATNLNIHNFSIRGTHVVPSALSKYSFYGAGSLGDDILVFGGTTIDKCYFDRLTITGVTAGTANTQKCIFYNLSGLSGVALDCGFQGTFTMGAPGSQLLGMGLAFTYGTIVDMVGPGRVFVAEGGGNVTFKNSQTGAPSPAVMQLGFTHGEVIFDSSCTGGSALIRGTCAVSNLGAVSVIDGSINTTNINTALTTAHGSGSWVDTGSGATPAAIADAVWDEPRSEHTAAGSVGQAQNLLATISGDVTLIKKIEFGKWAMVGNRLIYYDTNGTTPLVTFNLYDKNGAPITVASNVPASRQPI